MGLHSMLCRCSWFNTISSGLYCHQPKNFPPDGLSNLASDFHGNDFPLSIVTKISERYLFFGARRWHDNKLSRLLVSKQKQLK